MRNAYGARTIMCHRVDNKNHVKFAQHAVGWITQLKNLFGRTFLILNGAGGWFNESELANARVNLIQQHFNRMTMILRSSRALTPEVVDSFATASHSICCDFEIIAILTNPNNQ